MPRTRQQLEQAAVEAESWLDGLDPAELGLPDADASRLRRIVDAAKTAADTQGELETAVVDAREHGHTWMQIATALGTSRQAAQQRYGRLVPSAVE